MGLNRETKLLRRTFLNGAAAAVASPLIFRVATARDVRRINVADFGAASDGVTDVGSAVRAAVAACPKSGALLVFPTGIYRFTQAIGNAIELENFTDFEIDGCGSLFLLNGITRALSVNKVKGLHLHDFALDWKSLPFSQGTITNHSSDEKVFDVTIEGEEAIRKDFYLLLLFEPDTRLPRLIRTEADRTSLPKGVSVVGERILRLTFDRPMTLPVRTPVAMLHTRQSYGIIFGQSEDIDLSHINIHTAPGLAFAGTGITNLRMTKCAVAPPPGTRRLVSSTADAFHFWGSRGKFRVSQGTFSNVGDDCMNVHGFLLHARCSSANECIINKANKVNGVDRAVSNPMLPAPSDHIEMLDPRVFTPLGGSTVDSVSIKDNDIRVRLKSSALANTFDVLMSDTDELPSLEVVDCHFHSSINRGIIAHANALIERNTFSDLGWAGVSCSVDP